MRCLTIRTWEYNYRIKKRWHKWFAWYPIIIYDCPGSTNKIIWFELVLRKGMYYLDPGFPIQGPLFSWIYKYKKLKGEKEMDTNYEKSITLKKEYEDLKNQLEVIKGKMVTVKQRAKDELNWIMNDKIDD